MSIERVINNRVVLTGLVGLSLVFGLGHGLFLQGSFAAIVLVVALQLYFPGWLIVRLLKLAPSRVHLSRLMWALAAGLGISIVLGAGSRLLQIPVSAFLVGYHALMLVLIWAHPEDAAPVHSPEDRDTFTILECIVLGVCIIAALVAGIERSQIRIDGWEDQTEFVTQINWLANNPTDPGLNSLRVGLDSNYLDPRYATDGWTYIHAVWVYASGVPAWQFVWHYLTPLFIWTVPLTAFALAYELTHRSRAGALAAAGLTLCSLWTLDSLAYNPYYAYGQNAFVQLNTLRMFSTAVALPLAQMLHVAYLKRPRRSLLMLVTVFTLALAILHPRQIVILAISTAMFGGLYTLTRHTRKQLFAYGTLLIILVAVFALPFAQRAMMQRGQANDTASVFVDLSEDDAENSLQRLAPASLEQVFYHPIVIAVVLLGIAVLCFKGRQEPDALFSIGTTLGVLAVLLVPGFAQLFALIVTPRLRMSFIVGIPLGLVLGFALDRLLNAFTRRFKTGYWPGYLLLAAGIIVLLWEPLPISASARDQLRSMDEIQGMRNILQADRNLLDAMQSNDEFSFTEPAIVMAPNRMVNYIIETIPHTLTVGGRSQGNLSLPGANRFYNIDGDTPFLDTTDIAYLRDWEIDYIICYATDTRFPQLLMDTERFSLILAQSGYYVFSPTLLEDRPADHLFAALNTMISNSGQNLWDAALTNPEQAPRLSEWDTISNTTLKQYGSGITAFLTGQYDLAIDTFSALNDTYPDMAFAAAAISQTQRTAGQHEAAFHTLLQTLEQTIPPAQTIAAGSLLTPDFFPLLDDTVLNSITSVVEEDSATWELYLVDDQPETVRQQARLLAAKGRNEQAIQTIQHLDTPEIHPNDVRFIAAVQIARGDSETALNLLDQYSQSDTIAAASAIHPDRWIPNSVTAQLALLQGELALRAHDYDSALTFYARAQPTYPIASTYFTLQIHTLTEDYAAAEDALRTLAGSDDWDETFWHAIMVLEFLPDDRLPQPRETLIDAAEELFAEHYNQPIVLDNELPQLRSLLTLTNNIQIMDGQAMLIPETKTVISRATFGPLVSAPQTAAWQSIIFDPQTYQRFGQTVMPPLYVPGALTQVSFVIPISEGIPPFTQAGISTQVLDDAGFSTAAVTDTVTLNPVSTTTPIEQPVDYTFGELLHLHGITQEHNTDVINVSLFWSPAAPIEDAYQITVLLLNAQGQVIAQHDGPPMAGRYPTDQWIEGVRIQDQHILIPSAPLTGGQYTIAIGAYDLSTLTRLEVSPVDQYVANALLSITTFEVE